MVKGDLVKWRENSSIHNDHSRLNLGIVSKYFPHIKIKFLKAIENGRNRLISCLANYAIVVASYAEKGGTWAGAGETLKAGWVPIFVLEHPDMPEENRFLIQKGGLPFPHPFPEHYSKLESWLKETSEPTTPKPKQLGLL
jgi:predicted Rossmann fold nucleotide-binding protein DprA/Smf involved in DNA uptake